MVFPAKEANSVEAMNREMFERWCSENGTGTETEWFNGIEYRFITMLDGWIAIFEIDRGKYIPKIQSSDMAHARSYCAMIEPVCVPMSRIC